MKKTKNNEKREKREVQSTQGLLRFRRYKGREKAGPL
jgi:hypothetical protein